MIRIYTKPIKKMRTIDDNDSYFFQNISPSEIGDVEKEVMRKVDNAELIDANTGKIQTPRGIGSIEDLSTGCKTIINFLYLRRNETDIKAINISYCGYNALDVLFDLADIDDGEMKFVLLHRDGLFNCKERNYLIDDERQISSLLDL